MADISCGLCGSQTFEKPTAQPFEQRKSCLCKTVLIQKIFWLNILRGFMVSIADMWSRQKKKEGQHDSYGMITIRASLVTQKNRIYHEFFGVDPIKKIKFLTNFIFSHSLFYLLAKYFLFNYTLNVIFFHNSIVRWKFLWCVTKNFHYE